MLAGSRAGAVNARAAVTGKGRRLTPRRLIDGRYALPEDIRTNPDYSAAIGALSLWTTESLSSGDYVTESIGAFGSTYFILGIDGRSYYQTAGLGRLTEPAPDVLRFESRANDSEGTSDSLSGNRRSEVVCIGERVGEGTVWVAFTLILGPHAGLESTRSGTWGMVHQWHSVDLRGFGRSPILTVECEKGQLSVLTRSSASLLNGNGVAVTHYATALPAQGVLTSVVLQATFGQTGHLNAWLNGAQVVNVDTPLGYYSDLSDGSGRTELGYPHFGLYESNRPETDVAYIANPEWGAASLSARIASPLAVPDLTPWA